MSDWQVGDLALCVNAGPMTNPQGRTYTASERGLREGVTYTVSGIAPLGGLLITELRAVNQDRGWGFQEDRFRKITPDKLEECEPEFVTLIKRNRVPVSSAIEWLLKSGPIARKLNEDSKLDGGGK